jgi:quercetin dioxygenase-like cupin family protein
MCQTLAPTGTASDATGALWRLAEAGRQLDANLVRRAPGSRIDAHAEPDLDVLLLVVSGSGVLHAGVEQVPHAVGPGELLWLPHGSTRSFTAGEEGLTYLTVHRRRPGMQIHPLRQQAGAG